MCWCKVKKQKEGADVRECGEAPGGAGLLGSRQEPGAAIKGRRGGRVQF